MIRSFKKYLGGNTPVVTKLIIGLLIFSGAAIGVEILANFVSSASLRHHVEIFCEEPGEMLGETFFLWAAYDLLAASQIVFQKI